MDRETRMFLLAVRHWSGLALRSWGEGRRAHLHELLRHLHASVKPEVFGARAPLWRSLLRQRYPHLVKFFSHVPDETVRKRASDLCAVLELARECGRDDPVVAQATELCTQLSAAADAELRLGRHTEPEPLFPTHLGRRRFQVIVCG